MEKESGVKAVPAAPGGRQSPPGRRPAVSTKTAAPSRRVELLAPAGGPAQLRAAVENGADAVYLGGPLFNARMHADNFSLEDLREAVSYAHLRGVKIHVTLNTLLRDEELQDALDYAADLYALGADALIIQDLGLARLLRQQLPEMELHLSTQGTVYNLSGVRAAAELGFQRVVLAREVPLDELRTITAARPCEIEIFVHGALCICYSGQCQLSRVLGGRSGNRGECAQPCRLPYRDEAGRSGYLLSPRDLCLLDHLPELTAAGVDSLKIEGRMKSPAYVAVVTSIYRKYLDRCLSPQSGAPFRIEAEDRLALAQIFNRGGFTDGYLHGDPGASLLSGDLPKHQGVRIGTVAASAGRELLDIRTDRPLRNGDGIEIHSRPLTGGVVTYREARPGGLLRIGDIRGADRVKPGDAVFRITDSEQVRAAEASCRQGRRTTPMDLTFVLRTGRPAELTARAQAAEVSVSGRLVPEAARHRAVDAEMVRQQLEKTGGTPFHLRHLRVVLDPGLSLPRSELNRLRRDAVEALTERIARPRRRPQIERLPRRNPAAALRRTRREKGLPPADGGTGNTTAAGGTGSMRPTDALPAAAAAKRDAAVQSDGLLRLPPVTLGAGDRWLAAQLGLTEPDAAPAPRDGTPGSLPVDGIPASLPQTVLVENLGWIRELQNSGRRVLGGAGLNVTNTAAAEALAQLGVTVVEASRECAADPDILMITEHRFDSGILTDRTGRRYRLEPDPFGDKTILYREKDRGGKAAADGRNGGSRVTADQRNRGGKAAGKPDRGGRRKAGKRRKTKERNK